MDLQKNREKAVAERKAGANKVVTQICDKTGIDEDKLEWFPGLENQQFEYRLRVTLTGDRQDFPFRDEELSDYPTGSARTDAKVGVIIRWIKKKTP